jgi:XRE family aerobic/anaerobic benzoate catabolism transcriptional regulator
MNHNGKRELNRLVVKEVSNDEPLLMRLGQRLRVLRKERGLTIKETAKAAGLSLRFVAQMEAGSGNVSLTRLANLAQALEVSLAELLAGIEEHKEAEAPSVELRGEINKLLALRSESELKTAWQILQLSFSTAEHVAIALMGLRGAGKTTIGQRLAQRQALPFWEVDERIEDIAGLGLTEIFALHGEAYYRKLEAQALVELLAHRQPAVIALPGGIVNNSEALTLIKNHCLTIWLRARPEDHMQRVLAQGDRRPIANRPNAMAELRSILAAREPLYQQADIIIDTSDLSVHKTIETTLVALRRAGWQVK